MPTGRDDKSERQYEQIRENAKEHRVSDQLAEEVAARASHCGEHSRSRSQGPTKDQLYQEARKRHIVLTLLGQPDQLHRLREDPGLLPQAV
ncbi:hypothetical protein ACFC00_19055 [Streptomyces adustus]|uniref:hypothetical protein n=1 Tax=Streptomyces adustus TaxID=1609272 RepID=UPI0035D5863E